jgi:hypothetical protein
MKIAIEQDTFSVQKPFFNYNKKSTVYLIDDNSLLSLETILQNNKKHKLPNIVSHMQIDAEYNNADNIDMSDVEFSDGKKVRNLKHSIEKTHITKEQKDKYLNERITYKQGITVQIKGYNPNDTTYIYVCDEQLQRMKDANVNYTINNNGTIELPNMPSIGTFEYECEKNNEIVKWSRDYVNRVSDEDFLPVDMLRQQGYDVSLRYLDEPLSDEEKKETPIWFLQLYGHFLLVDIPLLFKQGTKYYEDLKKAYLSGRITQTRRLMGKSKIDCTCYFNKWIITINGIDYRVGVKIIDTIGLHGNATLKELCANTGVNITKELISPEEIKDMSSTHIKDAYKVHKYGTGDLVMTEVLNNYTKMMKEPYETFKIEEGYTPPALTMGKTVKNLFESYISNYCGNNPVELLKRSEAKKLDFFYNKTYKSSAQFLSTLANPENNAYLLSKCFGGMIRNNRPLISRITGALSDKDFTSAYAKTMSVLDYPLGHPVIVSLKNVTLKECLKTIKHELVDNLFLMIIKTPEKVSLEYEQVFLPSWDRETIRRYKKLKQDTEGYDVTGVVNLDSGYVKTFSKKLINSPIVSSNIDFIENELTPRQREDFYNSEVLTLAYYPKSLKVDNWQEVENKQRQHDIDRLSYDQKTHKCWTIINPNDCHTWTSFKLGNVVDELISKRNSYPKDHPLNTLYKLLNNCLYGDQVSQYFLTSNMIVGNNITALLRQQMYYSKTSLYMYGAITDGSISNDNEVVFPKYRIKNPKIEGRIFEYTGLFFEAINTLKELHENIEKEHRVFYNKQYYLLDDFINILNAEMKLNGFKNFPQSLILKVIKAKPVEGECLNKEKISRLYTFTKTEIRRNDIGHIKPLIGITPIELNKDHYIIDSKKYSIEEGVKLIEKAATEHPRRIWKNNQLLNGFYFILEKTHNGIKKYQLQQGLHSIEIKKPLIGVTFQGQGNYHTIDSNNEENTKRRGYESLKKKHTAFYFNEDKTKIITDTEYYKKESPATKGMKANQKKYQHFHPFIKSQIIKPKAYQKNRNKWIHSSYLPGEECLKVSFMRPLSLSQFTSLSDKQRNAWIKADNAMKKQYSYGLELYFLNNDKKTFNIDKMNKKFDEMICAGIVNPKPTLDKSYHLARKIPDWIYENHHAIKLMKEFINDIEIDDYFDTDDYNDDYNDEYDNDNFS